MRTTQQHPRALSKLNEATSSAGLTRRGFLVRPKNSSSDSAPRLNAPLFSADGAGAVFFFLGAAGAAAAFAAGAFGLGAAFLSVCIPWFHQRNNSPSNNPPPTPHPPRRIKTGSRAGRQAGRQKGGWAGGRAGSKAGGRATWEVKVSGVAALAGRPFLLFWLHQESRNTQKILQHSQQSRRRRRREPGGEGGGAGTPVLAA